MEHWSMADTTLPLALRSPELCVVLTVPDVACLTEIGSV